MVVPVGREPQQQRRTLLNLKCLFWCLHQMRQQYNLNLAIHSLERRAIHPDIANSHLGDNLEYLASNFEPEDLDRLIAPLARLLESRPSMEVGGRHFEIGHYVQAIEDFGPIAAGSYGVICSITPQLRGLFVLEGHLMESAFAPSNVRVIFGTYAG